MNLGKNIFDLRKSKNITQEDLAEIETAIREVSL